MVIAEYCVVGSVDLWGNWTAQEENLMTYDEVEGAYTKTYHYLSPGVYEFKVCRVFSNEEGDGYHIEEWLNTISSDCSTIGYNNNGIGNIEFILGYYTDVTIKIFDSGRICITSKDDELVNVNGLYYSVFDVGFSYWNENGEVVCDFASAVVVAPNEGTGRYSGDVVIPESITVDGKEYTVVGIGSYAFYESYVESLVIPKTVGFIGNYAFAEIYELELVKCLAEMAPCSYSGFPFYSSWYDGVIQVPCGAIEAYQRAWGYGDYNWTYIDSEYILRVGATNDDAYGHVEIQDNIGCNDNEATIYAYSEHSDYKFREWSDGNTDNPRKLTVNGNMRLTAYFDRYYNIQVYSFDESRGTVSGGGKYLEGSTAILVATPKEEYALDCWHDEYHNERGANDTLKVNVWGNSAYTAYFKVAPTLIDGVYYDLNPEEHEAVVARSKDYKGDIVIPASVIHDKTVFDVVDINYYAFEGTEITSLVVDTILKEGVYLGDCYDLKVLKAHADFIYNCDEMWYSGIEELYYIGGYVEYVDRTPHLKVVDLSVTENTELPQDMFADYGDFEEDFCDIRKLVLPNGLTEIADRQFEGLRMLKDIVIPKGVTEIPDAAFYDCHALSKVTFEGAITSIGNYAFYSCHALENIVIPEGVTEIGDAAFYACSYLENLELPTTVQRIGNNAFALCEQVKRMEVKAVIPPNIEDKTFYKVSRNIEFIVPEEAREAYAEHELWKEFMPTTDIENADETSVVIYTQGGMLYIEGVETDYNVFDTAGRLIYNGRDAVVSLPRGVYMLNVGDKTYKVAM